MKRELSLLMMALLTAFTVYSQTNAGAEVLKAVANGDTAKIKNLLQTNPDINVDQRDNFGGTALHGAMFKKNADIVKVLIQYGYDIDAVGPSNGYTPLHDAVWANYPEGAKLLITAGADLAIKNHSGLTPLELARNDGKKELIAVLEQAGKKSGR
jgi:ankyrin repeat protein